MGGIHSYLLHLSELLSTSYLFQAPVAKNVDRNLSEAVPKIAITDEILFVWKLMRFTLLLPVTFTDSGLVNVKANLHSVRVHFIVVTVKRLVDSTIR